MVWRVHTVLWFSLNRACVDARLLVAVFSSLDFSLSARRQCMETESGGGGVKKENRKGIGGDVKEDAVGKETGYKSEKDASISFM